MAVEANGHLDRLLHRLHAGTHLIGEHTAGGIHQGNLVDAGILQNTGLLGQLVRRQDVRLHLREVRLHPMIFNILNLLKV